MEDKAQKLYDERRKSMDLSRDVETHAMWGFCLSFSGVFLIGFGAAIFMLLAILPVSIILGIIGLESIKKNPKTKKGKGYAIAGIVISALQLLAGIITLIVVL